jgi:hypothetical protein
MIRGILEPPQAKIDEKNALQIPKTYCYARRRFWVASFLSWPVGIVIALGFGTAFYQENGFSAPLLLMLLPFIILLLYQVLFGGRYTQQERCWIREHGHESFVIDKDAITWHGAGDKNVRITWEEVDEAYFQDNQYVLTKSGTSEEEIRFWDTNYLMSTSFYMGFFTAPLRFRHLARCIERLCPLVKNGWEYRTPGRYVSSPPQVASPLLGGGTFPYNIAPNHLKTRALLFLFISGYLPLLYALCHGFPLAIGLFIGLLPLISVGATLWRMHRWFCYAQIETDAEIIALVGSKKEIVWKIRWEDVCAWHTDGNDLVFTTQDGQTYRFLRHVAQFHSLARDINRIVPKAQHEWKEYQKPYYS